MNTANREANKYVGYFRCQTLVDVTRALANISGWHFCNLQSWIQENLSLERCCWIQTPLGYVKQELQESGCNNVLRRNIACEKLNDVLLTGSKPTRKQRGNCPHVANPPDRLGYYTRTVVLKMQEMSGGLLPLEKGSLKIGPRLEGNTFCLAVLSNTVSLHPCPVACFCIKASWQGAFYSLAEKPIFA